jgi:ABC-type branched-subunit amino acid transport system substrate-binding protein
VVAGICSGIPLHFSATPLGSSTAAALIQEMKSKGYTKIGIAVTDEEHGISTEASLVADAKSAGMTTTAVQLSTTAVDATSQVGQLQAASPQAVIFVMNGASNGVLLKARTKLGWTVPFYSEVAGTSFNVGAQTTSAAIETLTDSSPVPNFVAQGNLYGGDVHFPNFAPADFSYVPVGPTVGGLVKSAS